MAKTNARRVAVAILAFVLAGGAGLSLHGAPMLFSFFFGGGGIALPVDPIEAATLPEPPRSEPLPIFATPAHLPDDASFSALGEPCGVSAQAVEGDGGMAILNVAAPCKPGMGVHIAHAGLKFDERLSPLGRLSLTIPALEADATFSIRFSDGEQAQASAALDGLQGHRHVALQWRGQTGLGIATQAVGEAETGAVVSALGDTGIADGWRAEVLTVATEKAAAARVFRVAVAAPVTPETCGRDIAATTLEAAPDGHYRSTPVTLSAAGCDSVGDIRLLKNLLSDLRVAPNEP